MVGGDEFAIGRKSAIETLKRTIENALQEAHDGHGKSIAYQLECFCAFNMAPMPHTSDGAREELSHILSRPLVNGLYSRSTILSGAMMIGLNMPSQVTPALRDAIGRSLVFSWYC